MASTSPNACSPSNEPSCPSIKMPRKTPSNNMTHSGPLKAQKHSTNMSKSGACTQIRQGNKLTSQTKKIEPPISQGLEGCLKGLVSNGCKAPIEDLMREAEPFLLIKLFCVLQAGHRLFDQQH